MTIVPDNILKLMAPKDRPKGNAGKTRNECEQVYSHKLEKDEHRTFSQWLSLKEMPFIHAQNHKKSTIQIGWPDFTMFHNGHAICIEFKVKGNKPSEYQIRSMDKLRKNGIDCFVCETAVEAIDRIRLWMATE